MAKKKTIKIIAQILVLLGAINWGLVAIDYNLIQKIFGFIKILPDIIYIFVGLSALYLIYDHFF